jgi:hypothetical protein
VYQSGFEHSVKSYWLGPDYLEPGTAGNDIRKTNVPNVRIAFRHETLTEELHLMYKYLQHSISPVLNTKYITNRLTGHLLTPLKRESTPKLIYNRNLEIRHPLARSQSENLRRATQQHDDQEESQQQQEQEQEKKQTQKQPPRRPSLARSRSETFPLPVVSTHPSGLTTDRPALSVASISTSAATSHTTASTRSTDTKLLSALAGINKQT